MEEIQEKDTFQEPVSSADNYDTVSKQTEGQAGSAPSEQLILGKFKSVNELSKAYTELEKLQGSQSKELGSLRQKNSFFNAIGEMLNKQQEVKNSQEEISKDLEKYNTPEYFQNPIFREIYKEAFLVLGNNLDTDRLVDLAETYVKSRIFASERAKAAQKETDNAIDAMTFSKNKVSSITPPKKRLDEMTPKEVDDLLERLI